MGRTLADVTGPVRPIRFAHAVFKTARYRELVEWWRAVLLAEVVHENPLLTFMTYDDEHHRIAIVNVPSLQDRPQEACGLEHVAYTYGSLAELLHTYRRLKALGIEPYWTVNHGPTTSMYYRDPDGNQVELQIDNFPDTASLHAWFRSGAFAKNPLGVPFEPEQLVARFESGEPLEELLRRPD
jgi:catechol-2,3-dioxygenase